MIGRIISILGILFIIVILVFFFVGVPIDTSKNTNIESFEYQNKKITECEEDCIITDGGISDPEELINNHITQSRYNEIGQQKVKATNYTMEFRWNNQEILMKNNNTSYYLQTIKHNRKYGENLNIWLNRIKPMYNIYTSYSKNIKKTDAERRMIKIINRTSYEPVRSYKINNSEYIVYSAPNSNLIIKSEGQIRKMSYTENDQDTFVYNFRSNNVDPIVRSYYLK